MAVVLQIGAGGVGGVVAHKMAMNREVFSRIVLASRTLEKCRAIADSIRAKGLGEIEIDAVDADNVESLVALIEKYRPKLVVNVALPYQDLAIMEACLRTKTHYLDTANYEHPDSAHFEYKEQWAYDARYKEAGIYALLGSGFDPGATNVFCAYAQKHYFDEIESIDILDCNAGDHGYAFATNFNPEINLREVSSKARYWVSRSACSDFLGSAADASLRCMSNTSHSLTSHNPKNSSTILEREAQSLESRTDSAISLVSQTDLSLNPDLQQDTIYRKFERAEKHFALESNTQDLKVEGYFGGQWRDIAPLALMKEWDYPEVGAKNSYLLYHEELESLVRNVRGLKRIRFFMTFGESYLTHMKCLENVGLLRVDSVLHKGGFIVPIEVLKTLLPDPASLASRTKGKTNIGCYMRGVKDGKERTIYIYNVCEHEKCYAEVNAQGVSYTTGVPAMIGAKLICEGKWGVGASKNVSLTQPSQELEKSSIDRRTDLSQLDFSAQPANLKQDTHSLDSNMESFNAERLEFNKDMPQGGEAQGVDSARGAGVWNMEQNDPDPFMRELNKQGLPYVVLEIESNGEAKVLEDGRG
ncbi:saccharopine dehydrogenase family protein [Helicobacter sp.]|uniref:saccharopine dehydrogenase family protein n=1 Tax=Helicobacter sp. TaxID=218 RepID=UPI001988AA56|nr:saccharopine dehydrogenase family protein [Helicobacter sp.]MBD5165364.1 saccharopine dehydrogenase family protein [Helicobacter sp.]